MQFTDSLWLPKPQPLGMAQCHQADTIGDLACTALSAEIWLSPKPGLVDQRNNGSHSDMTLQTFLDSITAIGPYFAQFALTGLRNADVPAARMLPLLRPIGVLAETAMCQATGNINTHKGGIFALGLLSAAAGRLIARGHACTADSLCSEVAAICQGLVAAELGLLSTPRTAGERLYVQYGMAGARGEAESGFATVRQHALPICRVLRQRQVDEERLLLQAMLHLLAHNADTNLVSRGGPEGLAFVQQQARTLLAAGGVLQPGGMDKLCAMDDALIAHHLSPGGCADLIAVTVFLDRAATLTPA